MNQNGAMIKHVIRQALGGSIGGAFMGALFALFVDPDALVSFFIWWAIGGAVFGVFLGLGRESLWTQIAGKQHDHRRNICRGHFVAAN